MDNLTITWPRMKGVILLGIGIFAVIVIVSTEPTFIEKGTFEGLTKGHWAFIGLSLLFVLMGLKMTLLPRVIVRFSHDGVYIPLYGDTIPWDKVANVETCRMKLAATGNSSGSVGVSRHGDGIRIAFDNTIDLPTKAQHREFYVESSSSYVFTAELTRKSADEIISILQEWRQG